MGEVEVMRYVLLSTATGANLGEFSAEGLLHEAKTADGDRGAVKCRGTRFLELLDEVDPDKAPESVKELAVQWKPDGADPVDVTREELRERLVERRELGAVVVALRPFVDLLFAAGQLQEPAVEQGPEPDAPAPGEGAKD